jgi:hypothetical protein
MDVSSLSDADILDTARKEIGKNLVSTFIRYTRGQALILQTDEERSKLRLRMDINSSESYIAVIIEFGSEGAVIVDGKIEVGERSMKELHFTSSARAFSGSPQMYYIHQE